MKKSRLDSVLIAVAFGVFAGLVLPLQTYLGNTSAYAYGAGRLVAEQALVALTLAGAVWTLLRFIGERAGTALSALFTGILVCLYLESGPLAFGLPEIDGDLPDSLACVSRTVWDGAVWLAVVGTAVATCAFTKDWLQWVALGVLVMGGASLFDVRRDEAETDGAKRGGYEMSVDIIENVEYSPTRNVLLFVLDNVDTMVAADIVARDPELAAKFPGFCAFRNNVGMHDSTKLGVPGLMTGRYFEPGRGALAKYIMSVFGPDSFLETYKAHGDAIYAMFCTCSYGYTTAEIPPERRRAKAEARGPLVLRKTAEVPYLCLNDAVLFRTLPFAFKRQFLATKLRHRATVWSVDRNYDHENTVFPILARRPVSSDPRQMLAKFHTHGGHPPFEFGAEDYRSAVSNALMRLGGLFDAYRENGVYDNSLVVVTADHGAQQVSREGEPFKCAAMLWVKAEGDRTPFAVCDTPTSHSRISAFMKAACGRSPSRDDIAAELTQEDRFYRIRDRDDRHGCFDFVVPADRKGVPQ